jgi:hypothetical protein
LIGLPNSEEIIFSLSLLWGACLVDQKEGILSWRRRREEDEGRGDERKREGGLWN